MRLFSIWLGVSVLRTLPALYLSGHASHPGVLVAVVFFVLAGSAVLLLWFFPRSIAARLLSPPGAEPAQPAPLDQWFSMGCALIGLWMLGYAVPATIRDIVEIHFEEANYDDASGIKYWLF